MNLKYTPQKKVKREKTFSFRPKCLLPAFSQAGQRIVFTLFCLRFPHRPIACSGGKRHISFSADYFITFCS